MLTVYTNKLFLSKWCSFIYTTYTWC